MNRTLFDPPESVEFAQDFVVVEDPLAQDVEDLDDNPHPVSLGQVPEVEEREGVEEEPFGEEREEVEEEPFEEEHEEEAETEGSADEEHVSEGSNEEAETEGSVEEAENLGDVAEAQSDITVSSDDDDAEWVRAKETKNESKKDKKGKASVKKMRTKIPASQNFGADLVKIGKRKAFPLPLSEQNPLSDMPPIKAIYIPEKSGFDCPGCEDFACTAAWTDAASIGGQGEVKPEVEEKAVKWLKSHCLHYAKFWCEHADGSATCCRPTVSKAKGKKGLPLLTPVTKAHTNHVESLHSHLKDEAKGGLGQDHRSRVIRVIIPTTVAEWQKLSKEEFEATMSHVTKIQESLESAKFFNFVDEVAGNTPAVGTPNRGRVEGQGLRRGALRLDVGEDEVEVVVSPRALGRAAQAQASRTPTRLLAFETQTQQTQVAPEVQTQDATQEEPPMRKAPSNRVLTLVRKLRAGGAATLEETEYLSTCRK